MEFSALPAIVRVLLATDGTVTRSLQAYFNEDVQVVVLCQKRVQLTESDRVLSCTAGQLVWLREVKLVGHRSGRIYAYARTYLNPENLPPEVSADLQESMIGVGELLQLRSLETFRRLLDRGFENALPAEFRDDFAGETAVAWRHYSISHHAKTLMHIREYFPLDTFVAQTSESI